MARKMPILRVAGPTVLVSLILFGACTASAVFLYRLHANTAESLADDIDSRRNAAEIETTLRNLITLLRNGSDQVDVLHERIKNLLDESRELASTDAETALQATLETSFNNYHDLWEKRFDEKDSTPQAAVAKARKILEAETLPGAVRLRDFNNEQILKSEQELKRTVKWFAWALAAVGCIGSFGGIFFGFGMARALRRSIYQLSVRIRDAADKLGHDLPTVTINESDGIDHLHGQMQSLLREIELMIERLHQREREVLRAEQMAAVGQLAAGVAHELRNPLTAVKMLIETSREELENRGVPADDLQIIESELRRLERTLQCFLDFARPPKMDRRTIDLTRVIDTTLSLLGGRVRKQGIQLDYEPKIPHLMIEADPEQLQQLLVNLTMNALDAMPTGGRLTIEVVPSQRGSQFVEVRVSDTGSGISAELLPRLFQPFVSGKETGLGLGLVVSQRIAEEHGGTLGAVNRLQGGACLTLRLPVSTSTSSPRVEGKVTVAS
jgi:two-component system sensor histidine kinase HydH